MPINMESTLSGIRKGAGAPGIPGRLSDQIRAQKMQEQKRQFEMQQGLREMMRKQAATQSEMKRRAFTTAKEQRESQQKRLFGLSQGLLTEAQNNPQAVQRDLMGAPKLTRALGVDPRSPDFVTQLKGARDRLLAQTQGKASEPSEQWRPLTPEEKRTYQVPEGEVAQINDRTGKILTKGGQTINVGDQVQSPREEARAELLKNEYDRKRKQRETARETSELTSQLSELIVQGDVETGAVQPAVTGLQNFASSIGVDLNSFAGGMGINLGDLSKKEEFHRLSQQLMINRFKDFKGNLNQQEVNIAADSVTQLGTSKEGNIRALASMRAAADLAERRANDYIAITEDEEAKQWRESIQEGGTEEFKALRDEYMQRMKENVENRPVIEEEESPQEFSVDNPAKPTTVEEYEELPEGTPYIHPEDGNLYRKK